jgi:hypothetical protein
MSILRGIEICLHDAYLKESIYNFYSSFLWYHIHCQSAINLNVLARQATLPIFRRLVSSWSIGYFCKCRLIACKPWQVNVLPFYQIYGRHWWEPWHQCWPLQHDQQQTIFCYHTIAMHYLSQLPHKLASWVCATKMLIWMTTQITF